MTSKELKVYAELNDGQLNYFFTNKMMAELVADKGKIVQVVLEVVEIANDFEKDYENNHVYGIQNQSDGSFELIFNTLYQVKMCSDDFFKRSLKEGDIKFVKFKVKEVF